MVHHLTSPLMKRTYTISLQSDGVDLFLEFTGTHGDAVLLFAQLAPHYKVVSLDHEDGNVRTKGL